MASRHAESAMLPTPPRVPTGDTSRRANRGSAATAEAGKLLDSDVENFREDTASHPE